MPKNATFTDSPGFGDDSLKDGQLAKETMKTTPNDPLAVIPPKSRTSDSIQEDFCANDDDGDE